MEKWKTFPCKGCLVKKTCKDRCFNWPTVPYIVISHINTNNLQGVCLACGDSCSGRYNEHIPHWTCPGCRIYKKDNVGMVL